MEEAEWNHKQEERPKALNQGGYSLAELLVTVAIVGILAAISFGTLSGCIERARYAVAAEKGHRLMEALKLCEMEHDLADEIPMKKMMELSGQLMAKPGDPSSLLYPYIGDDVEDCRDFTVLFKRHGLYMRIYGFTYTADTYEINWNVDDGMEIMLK